MRQIYAILLFIIGTSVLLQNCDCGGHLCQSPAPAVNFAGFDSTDLNTIIVKEYNNNGMFNDLRHMTVYTSEVFSGSNVPGPDTSHLDQYGIGLAYFSDYIIEVPAQGRTWYIKNITLQPVHMHEQECVSGLKYTLDDSTYSIPSQPSSGTALSVLILLSK